jgi:hypothetical protein
VCDGSKKRKIEKSKNKIITGVSGPNPSERSKGQQKKEGGVDVLPYMPATAAVFHFEMSALNACASRNAVGGCRCRVWWTQSKKNKIGKIVKIKAMGVSGKNSNERIKGQQKQEVEWTY